MKRFLSIAMALCIGLTMSLDVNAAKRFGGGKSAGAAPTHQTSQMAPSSPGMGGAAATAGAAGAAGAAAKAGGASRWLGPLAGIAAGSSPPVVASSRSNLLRPVTRRCSVKPSNRSQLAVRSSAVRLHLSPLVR
jgi:hypothetical protein